MHSRPLQDAASAAYLPSKRHPASVAEQTHLHQGVVSSLSPAQAQAQLARGGPLYPYAHNPPHSSANTAEAAAAAAASHRANSQQAQLQQAMALAYHNSYNSGAGGHGGAGAGAPPGSVPQAAGSSPSAATVAALSQLGLSPHHLFSLAPPPQVSHNGAIPGQYHRDLVRVSITPRITIQHLSFLTIFYFITFSRTDMLKTYC